MHSRDILGGFFADAAFAEACPPEKFARECAPALGAESASRFYRLLSEQHGAAVAGVHKHVQAGAYLPERCELARGAASVGEGGVQPPPAPPGTSVQFLVECLHKAVGAGEAHAEELERQLRGQLRAAGRRKRGLRRLIGQLDLAASCPDQAQCASACLLAQKCIAALRADARGSQ